jgi:hypothetical protein
MIYLIVGNHHTLSGVWEQIEITLRTFKEMDVGISISSRIRPGEVNILIEDFNSHIADQMEKVKKAYPDTKYILYVTEYLTESTNKKVTLNCFTKITNRVRRLFRLEYKYCGDSYYLYRGGNHQTRRAVRIRHIVQPILNFFAEKAGTTYGNELMMARREACLDRVRELFSLCISTTEAVLNGYDNYCDCPLKYLPVFVDEIRMKSNRSKSNKYPAIIFSGRLTEYREGVAKEIGLSLLNGYPLEGGDAWNKMLNDTEYKIDRLEKQGDAFGEIEAKQLSQELRQSELPSFNILSGGIYEYTQQKKSAAYEIYIPQALGWPYSSPNRTILSIESGLIPIDYGHFSDHDINQVAIPATDAYQLGSILAAPLARSYEQLDVRVKHYNSEQMSKAPAVKDAILKLSPHNEETWARN